MAGLHENAPLGLLVRSAPWSERSGREALDLAMAAAVMDQPLHLFFLGQGLLQLLADRDGAAAGLPPGQKAWASLPDLVETSFYGRATELQALASQAWWQRPESLDEAAWRCAQDRCRRLLVV